MSFLKNFPVAKDTKDKDPPKDEKFLVVAAQSRLKTLTSRITKNKKTNASSIWIHGKLTSTSSVNTAMTTVFSLTPLNLAEAKDLAPLYDAVRCAAVRFQVHVNTQTNAGVPANPAADCDYIVVFDYSSTSALADVANGMEFRHHIGPVTMMPTGYASSPGGVTPTGFLKSDLIKLTPTPVVDPGFITDLLGGNWVPSSDTGVVIGALKVYCEAAGASVATQMDIYVSYHLEYKNRG